MNMRDYLNKVQLDQRHRYLSQSAAEVLLKKETYDVRDWNSVMQAGGYYRVLPNISDWGALHKWLQENVGRDHYSWNGNNFWFETEEVAAWVALRWT